MEKQVKFEAESFVPDWTDDYAENKFAVYSTCFLSTKKNSHELDISEEVLRRDAKSILGNFLIADIKNGDSTTHTNNQKIFGYFPKEQEVVFDESEEGIVKAKAYCVISKMYSSEFNDIFSVENLRNTSVEMSVSLSEEDEHKVEGFDIYALTCLGLTVNGSCPDAQMEMVRFDENEAETFFKEKDKVEFNSTENNENNMEKEGKEGDAKMAEIEFSAVNIGDMWSKLWDALRDKYPADDYGSVYRVENIYEENNQKFAIIRKNDDESMYRLNFNLTEDGLTLAEEITKVEVKIVETDEIHKFAEPEDVEKYRTFAEPKTKKDEGEPEPKKEEKMEEPKSEEVEMSADEMKTEMAKLQKEVEDKENIIMNKDTKMAEMETELAELRAYKNTCMEAEKANKVESVMAEVSKFMDKETAKQCREKGMNCEFTAIDAWANEAKASVYEKAVKFAQKDEKEFTRMSGVSDVKQEIGGSALERLKNKYLN